MDGFTACPESVPSPQAPRDPWKPINLEGRRNQQTASNARRIRTQANPSFHSVPFHRIKASIRSNSPHAGTPR